MTGNEFQVGRLLAMLCTFVKFRKKKAIVPLRNMSILQSFLLWEFSSKKINNNNNSYSRDCDTGYICMSQCSRGIYPLFQSHIVWPAYAFCDWEHILVWKCNKVVARWYHLLDPHQLLVFSCLQNEPQDLLFILTARYRVFILSYKPETGDIVTRACGDVQVFILQRSSCLQGEVGTFISQY